MKPLRAIQILFVLASFYEIGIGVAFLLAARRIFAEAGIEAPNHWAYVQFPACLLILFGMMFAAVAEKPRAFKAFILPGIGLKISYVGITGFYWFMEGVPNLWKPFVIIDALFALAFVAAWMYLRAEPSAA